MDDKKTTRELFKTDDDILKRIKDEIATAYKTEIASGLVNSSNKKFKSSTSFYPGSLEVYLAGEILLNETDYDVTGENEVTLKAAPITGRLVVKFIPYE